MAEGGVEGFGDPLQQVQGLSSPHATRNQVREVLDLRQVHDEQRPKPRKRTKMHPEESGGPSRGCLGPERITATDPEFWILEIFGNKSKPERREKPRSNASPLQVTEAQRGKSNSEAPLTDDQHVSRRFQGADDEC